MNAQKSVHSRYHKAPLRGAWVRYSRTPTRAALPGGGRDDQVDVGFGQDSGAVTGEYGAHTRAQNVLSHIFSKPGSSPVRWSEGTTPGEPGTGVYGSDTGVNLL